MDEVPQALERDRSVGLETADSVELLRPRVLIGLQIGRETARMTELLRFCQMVICLPELCFGSLSVFDISVYSVPVDDLSLIVAQRMGAEQKPAILSVIP